MNKQINKVVIFAGGRGTRLGEYTHSVPKPLVPVAGDPIVIHLMRSLYRQGYREFILALGYKADEFKKYFQDYTFRNKSVTFSPFGMKIHDDSDTVENWTVHLVETGEDSGTGLRLHKLRQYIGDDDFVLTYGDGLSDVPMREVEKAHQESGKLITITAVPMQERFGILGVDGEGSVHTFAEKSDNKSSYINGGFMVCSNKLMQLINSDSGDLAYDVLTELAPDDKLGYFAHDGFWKAMDSKKDLDDLEAIHEERPELFHG